MHFISDEQIQRIKDAIIGVNILVGDNDYGIVVDVAIEIDNGNSNIYAETDAGFSFNAFQVYQLYRQIYDKVSDKVYPEGSDYYKNNRGAKAKRGAGGAVNAARMPSHARIGNESVNITERPY